MGFIPDVLIDVFDYWFYQICQKIALDCSRIVCNFTPSAVFQFWNYTRTWASALQQNFLWFMPKWLFFNFETSRTCSGIQASCFVWCHWLSVLPYFNPIACSLTLKLNPSSNRTSLGFERGPLQQDVLWFMIYTQLAVFQLRS